ncbi:MAG: rhodanese-like domain-containing protein [Halieaceae bacterium]
MQNSSPKADRKPIQLVEPGRVQSLCEQHPNVLVIDVRDHADHAAVRLPHSFCVPLLELQQDSFIDEHAGDPSRPLLLVCQLGKRAQMAAEHLDGKLENPLYVLAGGLNNCIDAGVTLIYGQAQ